ncbi:MAG: hypothetical protein HYV28_08580 [Ignavibacteriales bacterium]|nr:hypothetical protein [Ignavibacteriales bacterium]
MIKVLFIVLIIIHALIHLLGFVKAFKLTDIKELKLPISKIAGVFWLAACLLMLTSIILFAIHNEYWWIFMIPAIIISQMLIIQSWGDAKFGTIANLIILVPLLFAILNALPSSYINQFRNETTIRLNQPVKVQNLNAEDIQHLPGIVQKYLYFTGSVGKPQIWNFKSVNKGVMKRNPESSWIDISAEQYDFFPDNARFFYITSALHGIPFDGYHAFSGDNATMRIKIASLIQVVDAHGEKMNRGETVTLFNDICFMAPSVLADKNIEWECIDSLTIKAVFTNRTQSITALLYFNPKGELVNFISDDRYLSSDGIKYESYRWSTPVSSYKEFEGRKVASYGEAIWHLPSGKFSYAKFHLQSIEYNTR